MAYALNPGDIVELSYRGTLFNQVVMNVFHFKFIGLIPIVAGAAAMDYLITYMQGVNRLQQRLLECMCPEAQYTAIRAQVVWPTRRVYTEVQVALPGTFAGICTASNVSAVVLKQPDQAGRGRTGMVHVVGTPAAQQVDGLWQIGYLGALLTLAAEMDDPAEFQVGGNDAMPVIWSRVQPASPSQIIGGRANPYVRVQRRRTVGVGQ